jgi:hypothetical protein
MFSYRHTGTSTYWALCYKELICLRYYLMILFSETEKISVLFIMLIRVRLLTTLDAICRVFELSDVDLVTFIFVLEKVFT